MWNKLLEFIRNLGKQEEKLKPMTIEERIINSKDYQNKLNKRR